MGLIGARASRVKLNGVSQDKKTHKKNSKTKNRALQRERGFFVGLFIAP